MIILLSHTLLKMRSADRYIMPKDHKVTTKCITRTFMASYCHSKPVVGCAALQSQHPALCVYHKEDVAVKFSSYIFTAVLGK